jgi:hypothetical protein
MSGQPVRTPLDASKFRNEYMATLGLQASINDANYQANKVYTRTGAPSQPTDTRTTTEKLADLYRLRIEIRSMLGDIMSGDEAQKVVDGLDDAEAQFLAQQIQTIVEYLKPRFKLGVPAEVFNQYFQRYMRKFQETQGVEFGLQQETGRELLANQRIILDNMATRDDLNNVDRILGRSGLRDTREGRETSNNIQMITGIVEQLPAIFDEINRENNALTKSQLLTELNAMVRELPTKQQLDNIANELSIASEKRDMLLAERILGQLRQITTFTGDFEGELESLNQSLVEARARPVSKEDIIPEKEQDVTRAYAVTPDMYTINQIEYSYIPMDKLESLKKTSATEENILDYIRAIKNIQRGIPASEQILGSAITVYKSSYNRDRLIDELITKDQAIRQLWETVGRMAGKGMNTGLDPHKKILPTFKIKGRGVSTIDYTAGMSSEPDYVPFGKFIINRKKLSDGVIMIKRRNGVFMPDVKTRRLGNNLTNVFKKIAGGSLPSFADLEKLDDDEREYLRFISNKSCLPSKFEVPVPKKDKNETLINQFEIMRGQIIAGNDNKDLIRKFKKTIIEMLELDLIPKGQAKDILVDLARID